MFRIEEPFSLFPAAQLLGGEKLSYAVTQVEYGRESVECWYVLVRGEKPHTGRYVRLRWCGVFLQKERSHAL